VRKFSPTRPQNERGTDSIALSRCPAFGCSSTQSHSVSHYFLLFLSDPLSFFAILLYIHSFFVPLRVSLYECFSYFLLFISISFRYSQSYVCLLFELLRHSFVSTTFPYVLPSIYSFSRLFSPLCFPCLGFFHFTVYIYVILTFLLGFIFYFFSPLCGCSVIIVLCAHVWM
jgi:hypothetical protein